MTWWGQASTSRGWVHIMSSWRQQEGRQEGKMRRVGGAGRKPTPPPFTTLPQPLATSAARVNAPNCSRPPPNNLPQHSTHLSTSCTRWKVCMRRLNSSSLRRTCSGGRTDECRAEQRQQAGSSAERRQPAAAPTRGGTQPWRARSLRRPCALPPSAAGSLVHSTTKDAALQGPPGPPHPPPNHRWACAPFAR